VALFNQLSRDARVEVMAKVTDGDYTTPTCSRCDIKMGLKDTTPPVWSCHRCNHRQNIRNPRLAALRGSRVSCRPREIGRKEAQEAQGTTNAVVAGSDGLLQSFKPTAYCLALNGRRKKAHETQFEISIRSFRTNSPLFSCEIIARHSLHDGPP
jgi:hypothetical protein